MTPSQLDAIRARLDAATPGEWKRKGPKGCYRKVHDGRVVFLERAKPPFEKLFWLLHAPEPNGYVTHTLAAKTNKDVFVLADAMLAGKDEP